MSEHFQHRSALTFMALHASPPGFIMPNAWDAGSAIIMAEAGFEAIATTSAGIAFSLGKPDYNVGDGRYAVTREEMFERIRPIVDAVGVPVNGDLEAGYGCAPEAVAETIRLAIAAGLAGGNIEDKDPCHEGLYDERLAVERIAAAREAIAASRTAFVLTARTDAFQLSCGDALGTAVRRSNLYREAGADCLYPPGVVDVGVIRALVREIDGPLNIVVGLGDARANASTLLDAGVQRISLGGSIARSALGFVRRSADELRQRGTIAFAADQIPQGELNALFARSRGAASRPQAGARANSFPARA